MKTYTPTTVFLILFLLLFEASGQTPSATIPDFTFYQLNGTPFTKSQITGNTKVLFIFFDISCKHCQKEVEEIGKNYKEFSRMSLYMVSLDEPAHISAFMDKYGKRLKDKKNVTLLHDKDRVFIPKFSPTKYPALFIYSAKGKLIQYFGGEIKIKELIKAIK